jgi:hypothetical protein
MIISNVSSEYAARKVQNHMEEMGSRFQDMEDMTPEEADRKMGEFLKGMEDAQKPTGND